MWGYSLFVFIPASVSVLIPSICFLMCFTGINMRFCRALHLWDFSLSFSCNYIFLGRFS
uniref:Uncharacterized protein n=1 Tax=Arundo donax TaxID=35708 RepID=A0A0A9I3C4_ARUDO